MTEPLMFVALTLLPMYILLGVICTIIGVVIIYAIHQDFLDLLLANYNGEESYHIIEDNIVSFRKNFWYGIMHTLVPPNIKMIMIAPVALFVTFVGLTVYTIGLYLGNKRGY